MSFLPTVLVAIPGKELRWPGCLLLSGISDGEQYFRIHPLSSERVLSIQLEKLSWLSVALAKPSPDGGTKAGFAAMNRAIKDCAESCQNT